MLIGYYVNFVVDIACCLFVFDFDCIVVLALLFGLFVIVCLNLL